MALTHVCQVLREMEAKGMIPRPPERKRKSLPSQRTLLDALEWDALDDDNAASVAASPYWAYALGGDQ